MTKDPRGGAGRDQGNRRDDPRTIVLSDAARRQLAVLIAHARSITGRKISGKDLVEGWIAEQTRAYQDEHGAEPSLQPQTGDAS